MNGSTDWVSALAILASGLILGLMFIYFVNRRRAAAAVSSDLDLELRDMEARRDALVLQIRELDDAGSKLGPAEVAEERTRLELETAQVLRAIDSHKKTFQKAKKTGTPAAAQPAAVVVAPKGSAMAGFAWGAGSVLALGFLIYLVMQIATPREEDGSLTGGGAMGSQQAAAPQQPDPSVQRLEAAIASKPDDLESRVELARLYLERDNLMGVFDQTQYVLTKTPNDPRALTYQGLVRLAMGQGSEAVGMLEKATKIDPKFIDGWVALAWVKTQEGNVAEAEKAMQAAIREHPQERQRLEEVLAAMKKHGTVDMQQAATTPVGGGSGGGLPAGHPPITPESPRVGPVTAVAAGSTDPNAVRITLDGAAKGPGVVFLIARPVGVVAGPPVAVKRVIVTSFPVTVDLTQGDSMMGQPLPAKMRLEARLDSDGDAMTKSPSDPTAVVDAVSAGSAIRLTLK
ncbi:MAG TPA: tetratricopeptide repeat protein [Thermoanaerobaculia bacterium]|nr:tetratricopeptide repeat protein [Thermoanaerobaculia bacterium]